MVDFQVGVVESEGRIDLGAKHFNKNRIVRDLSEDPFDHEDAAVCAGFCGTSEEDLGHAP
jgi:hypothetical protein